MLSPLISTGFIALAAVVAAPALALPPDKIASKLDSIIVFAPVTAQSPGQPKPLVFELDGASRSVYFAAFSPAAVQQVIKDRVAPQNPQLAKEVKFAPFSLAKFDEIVQPTLQRDTNVRVIYVPDPSQVPITEKLLVQQGVKQSDADKIATAIPAVFCPQPAIKATPSVGPLKGQSFIPCSTDFQTVQAMVDKGVATSSELKNSDPKVVAIPITKFASMLAKGTEKEVGEIRVLPSPVTLEAIKQLRDKGRTPASATP